MEMLERLACDTDEWIFYDFGDRYFDPLTPPQCVWAYWGHMREEVCYRCLKSRRTERGCSRWQLLNKMSFIKMILYITASSSLQTTEFSTLRVMKMWAFYLLTHGIAGQVCLQPCAKSAFRRVATVFAVTTQQSIHRSRLRLSVDRPISSSLFVYATISFTNSFARL